MQALEKEDRSANYVRGYDLTHRGIAYEISYKLQADLNAGLKSGKPSKPQHTLKSEIF